MLFPAFSTGSKHVSFCNRNHRCINHNNLFLHLAPAMPTKPWKGHAVAGRVLTHRQQLQLANPMPKNQKSVLRTILRRKRMQLSQTAPPIKMQTPPYKCTVFRWGFPAKYSLGAVDGVELDYGIDKRRIFGKTTGFARVEVKPSNIRDSGNGTFALQDIAKDQLFTQYWGTILSETEADEKKLKVRSISS